LKSGVRLSGRFVRSLMPVPWRSSWRIFETSKIPVHVVWSPAKMQLARTDCSRSSSPRA
jgi:hypothetical protein